MTIPASIPFTCEECGARFDPAQGAACRICRRVLCGRHFAIRDRGLLRLLRRRRAADEGQPICRSCARSGGTTGSAG